MKDPFSITLDAHSGFGMASKLKELETHVGVM